MSEISNRLISWYAQNKRQLPWRGESDPYKIWLSEIILQQTKVNQGINYYLKITETFSNIESLAAASEIEVLRLWQGLGYYSRARNMHFAAKQVVNELNGVFPNTYNNILLLKGVGEYTAAAIASIAFNEPVAVVDGNVFRVLSRLFGVETPINSTKGKKEFIHLANEILDKNLAGTSNQAIMEFGALYCSPTNPGCNDCILSDMCYAKANKKVNLFPVKLKKENVKTRHFNYLVVLDNDHVVLNKRSTDDIWKGLYDFPLIETTAEIDENYFVMHYITAFFNNKIELTGISKSYKHKLTHRLIIARFYKIKSSFVPDNALKININRVGEYPLPRLLEQYIEKELMG